MYQLAILGAGAVIKAYGQIKADQDQAEAERQNAGFYREQADFAKYTGERKQDIFANETTKLLGAEASAFAKAGGGGSSAYYMAQELFLRQKESNAIKAEANMNIRLAMLRADQSTRMADELTSPMHTFLTIAGAGADAGRSAL